MDLVHILALFPGTIHRVWWLRIGIRIRGNSLIVRLCRAVQLFRKVVTRCYPHKERKVKDSPRSRGSLGRILVPWRMSIKLFSAIVTHGKTCLSASCCRGLFGDWGILPGHGDERKEWSLAFLPVSAPVDCGGKGKR